MEGKNQTYDRNESSGEYDPDDLLKYNSNEPRVYNLFYMIKITLMAAIGGFLFGYDTGVIGGADLYFYIDFPEITSSQIQMIVSLTVFGAIPGCVLAGPLSDNYGRKKTIIVCDVFFIAGALIMYLAESIGTIMIGRFVVGIGIGGASMVVPMYLGEASPTVIRGRLVTANILLCTFGQFCAYWVVIALGTDWRTMLGISGVPALIQLICMLWFHESPKWLMKMDRDDEANIAFECIFDVRIPEGREEMDHEIERIREGFELEDIHTSQTIKYKELFTVYRKVVFIGVMLQVIQQLSGINTMMYYGPDVLEEAGIGSSTDTLSTLYASAGLAGTNFLGEIIALTMIDRFGRRFILLSTLPGCGIAMCGLSLGMYLVNESVSGGSWLAVISMFTYIALFAIGVGGTPWTVNSEIYPLHLRGIGNSMATLGNWVANYFVSAVFLSATDSDMGEVITYFVLAIFCFSGTLFIYCLLPETKGRTVEENIRNIIPDFEDRVHAFNNQIHSVKD